MEGSILNNLGFDPVYLLIASAVLTLILLVVTVLCLINMRKLYRRYDLFMRGKDAETMENMIVDQMNAIIDLQSQDRYNKDSIRTANKNSRAAFQKIGIVKYNAFCTGTFGLYQYRFCIELCSQPGRLLSVSERCRAGRNGSAAWSRREGSPGAGSGLQREKARSIRKFCCYFHNVKMIAKHRKYKRY